MVGIGGFAGDYRRGEFDDKVGVGIGDGEDADLVELVGQLARAAGVMIT